MAFSERDRAVPEGNNPGEEVWGFFPETILNVSGSYNLWLVSLSVFIAVTAAYTSFSFASRITSTSGKVRLLWLGGGAVAMGAGIWSMHFIGMLAYRMSFSVHYDVRITVLSLLMAILVSGFALRMTSLPRIGPASLLVAGTLMGLGIGAMHYTGMMAMKMPMSIRYDPFLVFLSILIAVSASTAALWVVSTLRSDGAIADLPKKFLSALIMGAAISGMHYTGMAAARFPLKMSGTSLQNSSDAWLAVTIGLASFMILAIGLILSLVDSHLATRTAGLVGSLKAANEKLHYLALHDGLTRLPNRTLLEDRVDQAIRHARSGDGTFSVFFLDVDRFKPINDSLGHSTGDKVLQQMASRLSATVGPEDTVARIGGDEFVIVFPEKKDPGKVHEIARRIRDCVAESMEVDGQSLSVTTSIGISLFPHDGTTFRTLLASADSAMYYAKSKGPGQIQFYSGEMNDSAALRIEMENDLRRGIEKEEFVLYYQPKVSLATGEVESVEALVRWKHPEKGILPPHYFIPRAEETGLIIPLGRWIMDRACREAVIWHQAGFPRLRVAVNLSALQFINQDLVREILTALERSGLSPECLELEITESLLMQDPDAAMRTLSGIREKGVHVAIDDFGTGYSSFSYLKKFPLDRLKIDRSFITDICDNPNDAAIVRTIITLGHNLNLKVIAEGVESQAQLEMLKTMECDAYQGFYNSRPLPPGELAERLKEMRILKTPLPDEDTT